MNLCADEQTKNHSKSRRLNKLEMNTWNNEEDTTAFSNSLRNFDNKNEKRKKNTINYLLVKIIEHNFYV